MKYSILLIAFISSFTWAASQNNIYTIQETEDAIITGARKMIYKDSIIALIDVSARELFLIKRDGAIVKKITPDDSYSDSITLQSAEVSWFNKVIMFDTLKKRFPAKDQHVTVSNYYTHYIKDCTFFDNKIGYSSQIAAFSPESDTTPYFGVSPRCGFISEAIEKNSPNVNVNFIKVYDNFEKTGTEVLFYYGKYSDTFLAHCFNGNLSRPNIDLDTLSWKNVYRFIEYNRDIDAIQLVQNFPEELKSKELTLFLKDQVTQTSDSAFWSIGNYHDIVYNLKSGTKFQLNTPGNNCSKFIERIIYYEFNSKDSLRHKYEEFAKYLNYEVLSIDATPEDDLIIDLLHAVTNKETGKKEQYHILQKYSTSGELLAEKVFPQDGKLGNLQRIAYSPERDEFAFLIFKDQNWLLAYSKENQVW